MHFNVTTRIEMSFIPFETERQFHPCQFWRRSKSQRTKYVWSNTAKKLCLFYGKIIGPSFEMFRAVSVRAKVV